MANSTMRDARVPAARYAILAIGQWDVHPGNVS
jgi:type 1 glutamine amidotransferase